MPFIVQSNYIVCVLSTAILLSTVAVNAAEPEEKGVSFRDLHRDGTAKIIGHFGLPIGKTIQLTGVRARPLKTTNDMTLHVTEVNGKKFEFDERYSPFIQIDNLGELPVDETIIVEGYETLRWRGDPDINWHIDVPFVVTKVIAPKALKRKLK